MREYDTPVHQISYEKILKDLEDKNKKIREAKQKVEKRVKEYLKKKLNLL